MLGLPKTNAANGEANILNTRIKIAEQKQTYTICTEQTESCGKTRFGVKFDNAQKTLQVQTLWLICILSQAEKCLYKT